ncbi:MAG: putative pilus chaperone protein [Alphaproteobacteria bacterium]|nr:putative pilus chaperone protein [Alphaproteobacteria bacterium]
MYRTGFTTGRGLRIAALVATSTAMPGTALAQTIAISPVGISLAPGQATTVVRITNRGTEAAAIQVRPFAWAQQAGEESLSPTPELLVSPPLAKIAPGQTQTVRLLLKPRASTAEVAYRILFDQIPTQPTSGGIRVALRISIPVFALPSAAVRSRLSWRATTGSDGVNIIVVNDGPRHARLNDIKIFGSAGSLSLRGPTTFYLLPGTQRQLSVSGPGSALGTALRITASSDEGDIAASATIQPRP